MCNNVCKIVPSLYEADYLNMGAQLKIIADEGIEYVHVDLMDGIFVPNISFGRRFVEKIKAAGTEKVDVHLMIMEPIRFVKQMADAGADVLIVHYEACKDIVGTLREIRKNGMAAGIAFNPETPVSVLTAEMLAAADVIHIMSVRPGMDSQRFHEDALYRIAQIRRCIDDSNEYCKIEVDGCIGVDNIQEVVAAGADIIVSGKAVFVGDLKNNLRRMKRLVETAYMERSTYEISDRD